MQEPSGLTKRQEVRRGIVAAACLSLQPLLLNVISLPALAYIIYKLGKENYGQWMIATGIVGAVSILCALGLRGRFIRLVAQEPESAPEAFAEVLGTRITLTFLA